MGEPEARKAISEGTVILDNKVFSIEMEPKGSCDGCYFQGCDVCPSLARKICCTGGNILKLLTDL